MQGTKHIQFLFLFALISITTLLNAQSTGYINKGLTENSGFQGGVFIGLSSTITAYQPPVLTGGIAGAPILYWKDIVGIEQNGNTLTKTDSTGWGNAGAVSISQIECLENGWIQYNVNNLSNTFAFGLSNTNTDAGFTSIEYAVMLTAGNLSVYSYGQLKGNFGPVALDDSIRIERIADVLFYTKNNIVLYNLQVNPKETLMTDIALYTYGAAIVINVNSSESQKSPVVFKSAGSYINIKDGTTLIVDGKITLESNGKFDNAGAIKLKGDWNNNSGTPAFVDTLGPGKAWVEFSGANQSIGGTSSTIFNNVILGGSGRKVIGDGSAPVFNGNVTIQAGAAGSIVLVNQNNSPTPLPVKGNLAIPAGTNFENNGTGLSLQKNLVINGSYTGNGGLFFNGSNPQIISGVSLPVFKNLTINKSGGNITLGAPVKVDGILTLTKGVIITDSIKVLTINNSGTISGGNDSAYVSGPLKKIGNTEFTFPLGDRSLDSGSYHPLVITAPALATDAFTAEYIAARQPFGDSLQTDSLESISNCEYWTLKSSSGTSSVIPSLGWNRNSCNVDNYEDLTVAGWNGSKWKSLGNGAVSVDGKRGMIRGGFPIFGNIHVIIIGNFTPKISYAVLRRHLDASYYRMIQTSLLITDTKLFFKYDEEYVDNTNALEFKIYDKNRNVVISNTTPGVSLNLKYKDNRFSLNVLAINPTLPAGFYVLEAKDRKGEINMLRFKLAEGAAQPSGGGDDPIPVPDGDLPQ